MYIKNFYIKSGYILGSIINKAYVKNGYVKSGYVFGSKVLENKNKSLKLVFGKTYLQKVNKAKQISLTFSIKKQNSTTLNLYFSKVQNFFNQKSIIILRDEF